MSRRFFLKAAGLAGAGLAIGAFFPRRAQAIEWIYSTATPWQDRHWFPLDETTAKKYDLITLHQAGGPASVYDKLHSHFLKNPSNLQQELTNMANDYLARFGGTRSWAGFCHGVAHLNLGPKPLTEPETVVLDNGEEVTVTYADRIGIGAMFRSGDLMDRPILGEKKQSSPTEYVQDNLDYFMDRLIRTSQSFVINTALEGQSGAWYRTVWAVSADGLFLLATNFNAPGQEFAIIPRERVKEVYHPLGWEEAKTRGVDQRLYQEITGLPVNWRYDQMMNRPLVERLKLGTPLL